MDEYGTSFYAGTTSHIHYGNVLPQVGEEFILAENNTEIFPTFGLGQAYRIIEIEDVEYALPYCIVTENFFEHGTLPPAEYRTVYTEDHDKAIVAYLEKHGIRNPEVKEIFLLEDIVPQLIALQADRNREIIEGTFVYDPNAIRERPEYTSIIPYDYEKGGETV